VALFRRKRRFDNEIRRVVTKHVDPGTTVKQLDPDTLRVGQMTIGLSNLRAKWNRLDEPERLPWLEATVPDLITPPTMPGRLETTKPLRPGLRPRSMLETARLANLNADTTSGRNPSRPLIPFQHFGGDLVTVLLWDAPNTMSVISQSQLDRWGARFDDLLPVAVDNLEDQPHAGWSAIDRRVWTSLDADDYDGARMLLPGFLEQTGLAGELVVLHPNRNLLIVTAVDDVDGIRTACEMALEDLDAPSPISFQPLVGQGTDWRPLTLPTSHPAHRAWQRLTRLNDEMNYRSLLPPLQQLVGDDLYVSALNLTDAANGSLLSYTTWTEGVPSLLPRTDLIGLVTSRGEAITVKWEAVQRLLPTVFEPTDHYPELWRVMSFPDQSELGRLRRVSVR
jgi:hypothetical protein